MNRSNVSSHDLLSVRSTSSGLALSRLITTTECNNHCCRFIVCCRHNMQLDFADRIATLCLQHFDQLPKTGKPREGSEWTHVAAVVISDKTQIQVVAMGTGSKCIGKSSRSADGDVLNDSHAEVIARRAFVRYLYNQLQLAIVDDSSNVIEFLKDTKLCRIKPYVEFYLFVSHTPCGDASIFKCNSTISQEIGNEVSPNGENRGLKRTATDAELGEREDLARTGAKCLPLGPQDSHLPGLDYHVTGVLRTKPGRGERTVSLSCSDKMAKWNVVGIQGALLSHFFEEPLYLKSVIIGKCPFDFDALYRAVIDRVSSVTELPTGYRVNRPHLVQVQQTFSCSRQSVEENATGRVVPCSSSIIWSKVDEKPSEVVVKGRKQGFTNKQMKKASCSVCQKNLFIQFQSLLSTVPLERLHNNLRQTCDSYSEWKTGAKRYQIAMEQLRKVLPTWPNKKVTSPNTT